MYVNVFLIKMSQKVIVVVIIFVVHDNRRFAYLPVALGGAKDQWEIPKVRNLMGALWIPISLVLGYSEQFSESL